MTAQEVLNSTVDFLKKKSIHSARLDAEILLAHALGWQRIDLYSRFDYPLSSEEMSRCRERVVRRGKGEPVAYIVEEKEFYGERFFVRAGVLIPRPDSETLVERAVQILGADVACQSSLLDLGSGSGCLGLSLAKIYQHSELVSVDCSEEALQVTLENARRLQVSARVRVVQADLNASGNTEIAMNGYDLIVANPPYIAPGDTRLMKDVLEFEPYLALFAADDGHQAIAKWAEQAHSWLKPGGTFLCEVGAGQAPRAQADLRGFGFVQVCAHRDLAGAERVIEGRRGLR